MRIQRDVSSFLGEWVDIPKERNLVISSVLTCFLYYKVLQTSHTRDVLEKKTRHVAPWWVELWLVFLPVFCFLGKWRTTKLSRMTHSYRVNISSVSTLNESEADTDVCKKKKTVETGRMWIVKITAVDPNRRQAYGTRGGTLHLLYK